MRTTIRALVAAWIMVPALVVGTLAAPPMAGLVAAAPAATVAEAEAQAQRQLELMQFRLKMFHSETRSSMLSSLDLPLFAGYLSLTESRRNRYDVLGQIQLTPTQNDLRKEMEVWVLVLHKRFPIAESCLVDKEGQEHMRVVGGKVQPSSLFSSEEGDTSFFGPTLRLSRGGVFMSDPYLSTDAYEWVTAFASPVVSLDNEKLGFFHFEVPIAVYESVIRTREFAFVSNRDTAVDRDEEGRFFIMDGKGRLVADSRQETRYNIPMGHRLEKKRPDDQSADRVEDYLRPAAAISADPDFAAAIESIQHGETGVVPLKLNGRFYVLAYGPVPDRPWTLLHLDPVNGEGFWEK
ncbi:MAG: cache domain-containing protein [Alphaproteobacteria bacterium]